MENNLEKERAIFLKQATVSKKENKRAKTPHHIGIVFFRRRERKSTFLRNGGLDVRIWIRWL
jgi:hypothetical protein